MSKSDVIKSIQLTCGKDKILLNLTEIAKLIGSNRTHAAQLMKGCHMIQRGRSKYFLIDDVAERIAEQAVMY